MVLALRAHGPAFPCVVQVSSAYFLGAQRRGRARKQRGSSQAQGMLCVRRSALGSAGRCRLSQARRLELAEWFVAFDAYAIGAAAIGQLTFLDAMHHKAVVTEVRAELACCCL